MKGLLAQNSIEYMILAVLIYKFFVKKLHHCVWNDRYYLK